MVTGIKVKQGEGHTGGCLNGQSSPWTLVKDGHSGDGTFGREDGNGAVVSEWSGRGHVKATTDYGCIHHPENIVRGNTSHQTKKRQRNVTLLSEYYNT